MNIHLVKKWHSTKEALESILNRDREYVILTHEFPKGHLVKKHNHPNVNEWIIADDGEFKFFYLDTWYKVKPKKKTIVIKVGKGVPHGLEVISKSVYIVVRDGKAS